MITVGRRSRGGQVLLVWKKRSFWTKKFPSLAENTYVILLGKKDTQQHVYVDMIATNPIFKASSTIICDRISLSFSSFIIFFLLSLSLCSAVNWLSNFDKCSFTLSSLSTTIEQREREKEKVDFVVFIDGRRIVVKLVGYHVVMILKFQMTLSLGIDRSMRRCASMRSVIQNRLQLTCN